MLPLVYPAKVTEMRIVCEEYIYGGTEYIIYTDSRQKKKTTNTVHE